jgi:hypothetical protein
VSTRATGAHFHASQGEVAHDVHVHGKRVQQGAHGKTDSAAFAQMLGEQVAKSSPKIASVEKLVERPTLEAAPSSPVETAENASSAAEERAFPAATHHSSSTHSHTTGEKTSTPAPAHRLGQRELASPAMASTLPKEGPHVAIDLHTASDSARRADTDRSAPAIEDLAAELSVKPSRQEQGTTTVPAAVTTRATPTSTVKAQATRSEGRQPSPAAPEHPATEHLDIAAAPRFKAPEASGTIDASDGQGSSPSPSSRSPRREGNRSGAPAAGNRFNPAAMASEHAAPAPARSAKETPLSPTNANSTPTLVSDDTSKDAIQGPMAFSLVSSSSNSPSGPTIRHHDVPKPIATEASLAGTLPTHAGAGLHRAPPITHPPIVHSPEISDGESHAEHVLPTKGPQDRSAPVPHAPAGPQDHSAPMPHAPANAQVASVSALPVHTEDPSSASRHPVQVEAAAGVSPAKEHKTRGEGVPSHAAPIPPVPAIPTSPPNQAPVSDSTADVPPARNTKSAAPPEAPPPLAPHRAAVKERSARPAVDRASKGQEAEPTEPHPHGGTPAHDAHSPSASGVARTRVENDKPVPVTASQSPAAPVATPPNRTGSKTSGPAEPSSAKARDRHADDDEPAESPTAPSTPAPTNALPSHSSSSANSEFKPAKSEAPQSSDSRKIVEDSSRTSHAQAAAGQPQVVKAEVHPAVLPADRPTIFTPGAAFLPANSAAPLPEPAAASPVAAERAAIFDRAIDDPGLSVNVLPHSAHLSIAGDAGDLALHVRVRDGSADVNVSGTMAPLFHAKAPEVRAVLAGEGLQLGSFATDQQGHSQGQQGQPEGAPRSSDLPPLPQPRRTSVPTPEPRIGDDRRIHVTA